MNNLEVKPNKNGLKLKVQIDQLIILTINT